MRSITLLVIAAVLASPAAASACYDLKIRATPVEQVPSEAPDCADCIIMRWPWFIDLRIKRVLEGPPHSGVLRVLSVQHTWFIPRASTWVLRRNTLGGFNVAEDDDSPRRCAPNTPPARPYISPGNSETLDDLRAKGLARYGPAPR